MWWLRWEGGGGSDNDLNGQAFRIKHEESTFLDIEKEITKRHFVKEPKEAQGDRGRKGGSFNSLGVVLSREVPGE